MAFGLTFGPRYGNSRIGVIILLAQVILVVISYSWVMYGIRRAASKIHDEAVEIATEFASAVPDWPAARFHAWMQQHVVEVRAAWLDGDIAPVEHLLAAHMAEKLSLQFAAARTFDTVGTMASWSVTGVELLRVVADHPAESVEVTMWIGLMQSGTGGISIRHWAVRCRFPWGFS